MSKTDRFAAASFFAMETSDCTAQTHASVFGKSNPFPAPILKRQWLTKLDSSKEIIHIELSLAGSGLTYEVGDALGVKPQNSPALVDELIERLGFSPDELVPVPDSETHASLRAALIFRYDITKLTKSVVEKWQAHSSCPELKLLSQHEQKESLAHFIHGRGVIDLAIELPAKFANAAEFVSILKKIQPRLYSIASSPKVHPNEVHLTVSVVRYEAHGRQRAGICSSFLSDCADGIRPLVFIHSNKAFRLPQNTDDQLIMIGPGTGIAPFRAFLEERHATKAKGKNWLFFGNPYRATDFCYKDELESMEKTGHVQLSLAFSRDQANKIYVQDKMREAAAELWEWLENGACFYVCGDASQMAKDVDEALHDIVSEQGGMPLEAAANYISNLKKSHRYCRDVY